MVMEDVIKLQIEIERNFHFTISDRDGSDGYAEGESENQRERERERIRERTNPIVTIGFLLVREKVFVAKRSGIWFQKGTNKFCVYSALLSTLPL